MDTTHARYCGLSRKLVVAFDIGTTFSGAAYAFLDPGEIPQIRPVTKYLNNPELESGRVPSTLFYDHNGTFRGVENGVDFRDSGAFLKVKWWKQILSPKELPVEMENMMYTLPPRGKTTVDLFADFMRYLFDSTEALFKSSEPNGELRWASISKSIELVLTHPKGWERAILQTAAVEAGIVPDTPVGRACIYFVTEGEASLNFCATQTQAGKRLKSDEKVSIIDVGGGTVDISAYVVLRNEPLEVEELDSTESYVQGGEFVKLRAVAMAQEKLKHSKFNTPEYLAAFSQAFDEGVKKHFSSSNRHADQYVKFGSPRDNDPSCEVEAGQLKLTGAQVAGFFEPSILPILDYRFPTDSFAFLVGGFAASPWFSEQLEEQLLNRVQFYKPDMDTEKAVAIGAVSYYITRKVSKFTYGVFDYELYDDSDPQHIRRAHKLYINPMGERCIPGCFLTMLEQGTEVLEDREIPYCFTYVAEGTPRQYASSRIVRYTGIPDAPSWEDEEPDKFETLCYVKADISSAPYEALYGATPESAGYKRGADVILLVSPKELKVQISWIDSETGEEQRSDPVAVYDNPLEEF